MSRISLILAALLAALAVSARAEPSAQITREVAVRFDDLDLSKTADAQLLLKRLHAAASQACGGRPFAQNMNPALAALLEEYRKCRNGAVAGAVASLRSPAVDRLFAMEAGAGSRLAER